MLYYFLAVIFDNFFIILAKQIIYNKLLTIILTQFVLKVHLMCKNIHHSE